MGSITGQVDGGREAQRVNPNVVLPFLSSLLSFIFAILVADQWLRRRQPYQLVWAIGLLWYGISAGTEFLGGAYGWNEPLYRVWYLIGAFGVAAYLGLGTVWLLRNTRFGYFVAFSVFAGGLFSILAGLARIKEGDPASRHDDPGASCCSARWRRSRWRWPPACDARRWRHWRPSSC